MDDTVIIPAPASKSLSHRALMAAGLASGVSRLEGLLDSDDIKLTREVMTSLGARYSFAEDGACVVTGLGGALSSGSADAPLSLFVGESGTTCRLITAIAAAGRGWFRIHGSGRMHERPLGELAGALEKLGARIRFEGKDKCPPLVMQASGLTPPGSGKDKSLPPGVVKIGCDESSQYLSGLLLAAPLGAELGILLGGKRAVSWPYVGLTLELMEHFGVEFAVQALHGKGWRGIDWRNLREAEPGKLRFIVRGGGYRAQNYRVEGDWSGASYFLAAGAIGPKAVQIVGINAHSLQGDASIIDIMRQMGAKIAIAEDSVTVSPSDLRGVDVDMGHCPDLVPTVAALAAHARGETRIRNVAHLAIKESDRIAAPAAELAKAGCRVQAMRDGMVISPPEKGMHAPVGGEAFSAHNDHRIAMSVALLGLPGRSEKGFAVRLDNPGCVAKSFPAFWRLWEKVVA